jgi:hypothetical protein
MNTKELVAKLQRSLVEGLVSKANKCTNEPSIMGRELLEAVIKH